MRKLFAACIGLAIAASLAVPGQAAKPSRYRSTSSSANAFWYDTEWLSPTSYRSSVWYIGVYRSTDGSFSDVYREVLLCDLAEEEEYEECQTEEFAIGYKEVSGTEFRISKQLRTATLDADYELQAYDGDWDPIGDPDPVHVTTEWERAGRLERGGGTWRFQGECYSSHSVFRDRYARAEATGSVDGLDLGETYDAGLGYSAWSSIDRSCE